ncbi:MAG: nucleotidyltransferase family protein, partial [Desulfobacterales bacterium]|nr:nucleotidyltransferase family protein [Desulfobacterales bacterium]
MNRQEIFELLCRCLSGRDADALAHALSDLTFPDWERLIRMARFRGVAPFLFHRLDAPGPREAVPADLLLRLRKLFFTEVVTNLNLYARLGKVLKTMRRERVPVIALKGAYLAQEVYDSIGLRRMSDVDLLVPKSALRKAADSLVKIGYRPVRDFKVEVETALSLHLPPFKKPDAPPVEIHWTIEKPIYP